MTINDQSEAESKEIEGFPVSGSNLMDGADFCPLKSILDLSNLRGADLSGAFLPLFKESNKGQRHES